MENSCKLCAPLGACLAFKGIEGALPMLHGSQGCATYIRRYLISHFREPMDIASSNFSEATTIFGGNTNFNTGIDNIIRQYQPAVIAIASTCLAETIGEDVLRLIYEYRAVHPLPHTLPAMLFASTPSYRGSHEEGFHRAVAAAVKALADPQAPPTHTLNLFCNFISPEDIRHLKDITDDFGIPTMLFPDYSDTLDGTYQPAYQRIPEGGTPLPQLRASCHAQASIELGYILNTTQTPSAGEFLRDTFDLQLFRTGIPIGIRETDKFFQLLAQLSGKPIPPPYQRQRGRLIDLYIDGHKYLAGKRALIYGEEDLVVALAAFAVEVGIRPILCASGGESGRLEDTLRRTLADLYPPDLIVGQGMSFEDIRQSLEQPPQKINTPPPSPASPAPPAVIPAKAGTCQSSMPPSQKINTPPLPDLILGSSKGYHLARRWNIPLIRVGFPIHDRIGAPHQSLLAYQGASRLFERIVNSLLASLQHPSKNNTTPPPPYQYM